MPQGVRSMNKAVYFLKSTIKDLPSDIKKKIKPDPMPLAEKWGSLQVDMLKKIGELQAIDKSMQEQLVGMSAAIKKLIEVLPQENAKEGDLLRKLFGEYDKVFRDDAKKRVDSLSLGTTFKM
jgi:hypothetical protein